MGPNARVFKVYLDEATNYTNEVVENWRESLDVLLVFVSLCRLKAVHLLTS